MSMSLAWLITIVLALVVGRIVYIEIKCGRKHRDFLTRINKENAVIQRQAVRSYKDKHGRDPSVPFLLVDAPSDRVSSKK